MRLNALYLALSFLIITSFGGCGEKSEDKKSQETTKAISSEPVIEITQNSNANEIKVQEKQKTKLQVKDGKAYYYDYNIKSEYDQNAQPANSDASVRIKPRTAVEANMNIRSPYEDVQISLLTQKLSKKFRIKCSACHDDYANGIIGPSLLSRDSNYIYGKIAEFKTGKKSNPLMSDLIKMMSDAEIKEIANEIYEFNKKIKEMRNK
jgi:cytochrome c553